MATPLGSRGPDFQVALAAGEARWVGGGECWALYDAVATRDNRHTDPLPAHGGRSGPAELLRAVLTTPARRSRR
jgi:hypothetical protein